MKIVVCVKQVPDTAAKVVVENGQVTWGDAPLVINPWDEYAVETALLQQEAHGGDVTVVSVGDENAREALKHALAMGCNEAILITDTALNQPDSLVVSHVLAAAVQKIGDFDAVFFGKQAIDGDVGVTAAQTARVLGWPAFTLVSTINELDPNSGILRVERSIEEGRQIVEGKLPAVISVVKDIGEPRYPSFMGIRKASRANIRRDEGVCDAVAVEFRDTGQGIPPEQQKRLFGSPFGTTKAKGTGLGLAVVARIVEAHRGEVTVRSRVRRGTAFRVVLPVGESGQA